MKITLTSHACNHLLRLAEGLQAHNALNRFYTIYPRFKIAQYHIDKKFTHTFYPLGAATYLCTKFGTLVPEKLHSDLFDGYVAAMLRFDHRQSNIVQGNSGFCLKTLSFAQTRGIKTLVDRACPHIDFQLAILDEEAERLTGKTKQFSASHKLREKMLQEYELADGIIVPSTYTYNSFIQKGFTKKQLHLAPLMKEKNVTRAPEKSHTEFTVLAVGFSFYRKGFYYLLKAWNELRLPNAKLIIRNVVPAEFQSLLKNNSIHTINHHLSNADIIRLYQQCDVFCLPSIDEGFGMAAVEAMAAAKPVIVTHNVGMHDIISDKNAGFILPIRDSDAIKESITALYENRELMREMGENAHQCEQRYSRERYVETMMRVYQTVLNGYH